jgi:hypothetical protein
MTTTTETLSGERTDVLAMLAKHRFFLKFTLRDLTDEQAALSPTPSALCLGGLVKHVAAVESKWVDFVLVGTSAQEMDENSYAEHAAQFRMAPGETVDQILAGYDEVAHRTDEVIRTLPDLGLSHPLPAAPWFEPGASWSARRVFMHIIAETAQHSGHADIIRESIDGARSMG